jgi:hypothetical protein
MSKDSSQILTRVPDELDYKTEYNRIACVVGGLFPECEVTTVDMVILLAHEVDTLRLALGIPTRRSVLARLDAENAADD